MGLEGRLSDIGLADLLDVFAMTRCTGAVELSSRGRQGRVALHQGAVIQARVGAAETVGEALLRAGKVSEGHVAEALRLQSRDAHQKLLLGTILVNCGAIGKAELELFLRERVRVAVQELCDWETGAFRFSPQAESPEAGEFPDRVEVAELLAEVAQTTSDTHRLARALPEGNCIVRPAPDLGARDLPLRLSKDEWAIFWLVGRGRRIADVLAQAVHLDKPAALAALHSLLAAGVLISDERDSRRFRLIENGLRDVVRGSRAKYCVLVSPEGHSLYEHGLRVDADGGSIGPLAAGALMCIETMCRADGTNGGYSVFEGHHALVYLNSVSSSALLLVVCDGKGQLGQVRLLAREFAESYGPFIDAVLRPVSIPPRRFHVPVHRPV